MTSIRTLLIANRGEIACRIIRSAHGIGLRTVAVASEPDLDSPHVGAADVTVALGGSSATESYLDVSRIVSAALATGADAVHPGYGFLAENHRAAAAVEQAGLIWIGPSPEVIARMGDKIEAKRVAAEVGVPTLPSVELRGDEAFELREQAAAVGYPLLVKAAGGGGGKGMRLVHDESGLVEAVVTARREAASSFGDPTVFAERWLPTPRHVEIQIVADTHGHVVHLGERECSIQRRHQKIIEEAPSPAVDPDLRARMGAAAVALARAIDYDNLGTVEFLLDDQTGEFFFLEMNTRLQVEHPVTEEVTGLDLVELQLHIARGEPLPFAQDDVGMFGHAIEVRLYAEDPSREWLPSTGTIHRFAAPTGSSSRVDSGVATGGTVTPFYDPMLAKIVSHAADRREAAAKLVRSLTGFEIHGLTTNRDYLVAVLEDRDFLKGRTTTAFVEDHPLLLDAGPGRAARTVHGVAAMLVATRRRRSTDPHWSFAPSGWRNLGSAPQHVVYTSGGHRFDLTYEMAADNFEVTVNGEQLAGRVLGSEAIRPSADRVRFELGGLVLICTVHTVGATSYVNSPEGQSELTEVPRFTPPGDLEAIGGPTAPVPGRVIAVEVAVGDDVDAGDTLVVLEAMKVEHSLRASGSGVVTEVLVVPGDNVDAHQVLVRIEEH